MAETTFRSSSPTIETTQISTPPPDPSNVGANVDPDSLGDIEPIEIREERGGDILLETLGIDEPLGNLSFDDQENLSETKAYIKSVIKSRGIEPNMKNFKVVLDDIKSDMGLDDNVEPTKLLDRIGNVVKSWKELSFLKDVSQKRRIFSKLLRANSGEEMNRLVFEEMERNRVWQ